MIELLQGWGGATIAYRRPGRRAELHAESRRGRQGAGEGIRFAEGLRRKILVRRARPARRCASPRATAQAMMRSRRCGAAGAHYLVAAGTQPKHVLARDPRTVLIEENFQASTSWRKGARGLAKPAAAMCS